MDAAVARHSICRATSECSVVTTLFATSGRSSCAISSPSTLHHFSCATSSIARLCSAKRCKILLNERYLRPVEVGALNVGLSRKNADVLPERLLFDHSSEAFSDFVPHHIEWQPLARNALIDSHDVEAVTGLDQLSQQAGWSQSKYRLLEPWRHRSGSRRR
jgi:hypothetical protein